MGVVFLLLSFSLVVHKVSLCSSCMVPSQLRYRSDNFRKCSLFLLGCNSWELMNLLGCKHQVLLDFLVKMVGDIDAVLTVGATKISLLLIKFLVECQLDQNLAACSSFSRTLNLWERTRMNPMNCIPIRTITTNAIMVISFPSPIGLATSLAQLVMDGRDCDVEAATLSDNDSGL